jgi:hypothetical protein
MMPRVLRRLAIVAAVTVAAAALAAEAGANGDPASDFLPLTNVFLSLKQPKQYASGRELLALTADAKEKRFPVKVAVISQPGDLGLIQSLWQKPQAYAKFLGQELIAFARYHGTLIVTMPNGFGVHGPGATSAGKGALAALPKPNTSDLDKLGNATATAVVRVARANGHTLPAPSSSSGSGTPAWLIALAAAGGAVLIAAAAFVALRRWLLQP